MIENPWKLRKRRRLRTLRLVENSGLFDSQWFRKAVSAVEADLAGNPLERFVDLGWRNSVDPHPCFWTAYYRTLATGSHKPGSNPLSHYVETGWRLGIRPNPIFDPTAYMEENSDLAGSGVEPLRHYLDHGWMEGRIFDHAFRTERYRRAFPTISTGQSPLEHFLTEGWRTHSLIPRSLGEGSAFDSGIQEIVRFRCGGDMVGEVSCLGEKLKWYHQIENTLEENSSSQVLYSVRCEASSGEHLEQTLNSLTRQIGGGWRVEVADPHELPPVDAGRLKLLMNRCPESFRWFFGDRKREACRCKPRIRVKIAAGELLFPEATVSLVRAVARGEVPAFLDEKLYSGRDEARVDVEREAGVDRPALERGVSERELLISNLPSRCLDYLLARDPLFWSCHDFVAWVCRTPGSGRKKGDY